MNGGPVPVYSVRVVATFFNAADQLLAAQESFVFLPQTSVTQANPFKIQLTNAPANIDHYELNLNWDEISVAEYDRVTIVREETSNETGVEIFGELRNDHPSDLRNIVVVATFYDESGQVLDVYQGTVEQTNLAPGETTQFRVSTGADLSYASFLVQTQGLIVR